MKLNKILAAALVAASSVSATAAILAPSTGNGELFLVMFDVEDKISYTKDLGVTLDAFTADSTSTRTFNLNDSFFNSFLQGTNASISEIKFAVVGADSVNVIGGGGRRLFTTIDSLLTPLTGSQHTAVGNTLQTFTSVTNGSLTGNHSSTTNGTSFELEGTNRYAGLNIPTLQSSAQGWGTANVVGTAAAFRSFGSAANGIAQTAQTTFLGSWSVNNNAGVYSAVYAVPEADGIAMALAGFGALGFIAFRRRQS